MSIFDHNKKSGQIDKGQSKLGNTEGSLLKNFDEIAKEFLPTDGQESRMSNAFASLKSQPKSQEEIGKEFLPTKDQASRLSNAFASLKSQPKSQEEITKEFAPSKGQTFKHDNGENLGNQKPKYR